MGYYTTWDNNFVLLFWRKLMRTILSPWRWRQHIP